MATTQMHKVRTTGVLAQVDPTPGADVLEVAPAEVRKAREALDAANAAAAEARTAAGAIRKERRLAEVPSAIRDLEDKAHEAEQEERTAAAEARRAATAYARLLDENVADLRARRARLNLERHVRACDAYADFRALVGGGGVGGPGRPAHALMPWVEPGTQARPNVADFGRYLDETNVPRLLEQAGGSREEFGLVWVRPAHGSRGRRFLTTRRRAEVLPSAAYVVEDDEVEEVGK